MSEFVDTAGWDWIVSTPLATVNDQIAERSLAPLKFLFSEEGQGSGLTISGSIDGFRLNSGLGLMPAITLYVTGTELNLSSSCQSSNPFVCDAFSLVISFPVNVRFPSPEQIPTKIQFPHADNPLSRESAHQEKLTLEIQGTLLEKIPDKSAMLLNFILAAGFRENMASVLQWIAAPLCFRFQPFPRENDTPVSIARFTMMVTSENGEDRIYRHFYLSPATESKDLAPDEIDNLQPLVPAQLTIRGDSEYVALSPGMLPAYKITTVLTEALERAQLPQDMPWSYLSTPGESAYNVKSVKGLVCLQHEHTWQPALATATEAIALNLHSTGDFLPIEIGKFEISLQGDALSLNYAWQESIFPFSRHHTEQQFRLTLTNASDIRGDNIALILNETSCERKIDSKFFFGIFLGELSDVYYTTLNLSQRLAQMLTLLPLKIAAFHPDGSPVQMETGYVHGGGIFSVAKK